MDFDAISCLEPSQARAVSSSSSWQRACGPWEWWTGGDEKDRGHELCASSFVELLLLSNFHARVVQVNALLKYIFRTNKENLRPAANTAGKSGSYRTNILIKKIPGALSRARPLS